MNPQAIYACFALVHQPCRLSYYPQYREHDCHLQAAPDNALIPQLRAGEARALHERVKLGPHDAWMDAPVERALGETAIGAGNKILPSDQAPKAHDPLGDELGMLDDIGGMADDAWNEQTARR